MEQQQAGSFNLRFRTDEDTGLEFFQIVDKKSGEVIRQYPPEEYLALVENLREVTGLIVSDEV
jgi:flagellar protein FlaG